jgi:hypothetical protein
LTRPKADLLQGTVDMPILKALGLGPLHGYGIIQRIRQLSDELLEVEQGSLSYIGKAYSSFNHRSRFCATKSSSFS